MFGVVVVILFRCRRSVRRRPLGLVSPPSFFLPACFTICDMMSCRHTSLYPYLYAQSAARVRLLASPAVLFINRRRTGTLVRCGHADCLPAIPRITLPAALRLHLAAHLPPPARYLYRPYARCPFQGHAYSVGSVHTAHTLTPAVPATLPSRMHPHRRHHSDLPNALCLPRALLRDELLPALLPYPLPPPTCLPSHHDIYSRDSLGYDP